MCRWSGGVHRSEGPASPPRTVVRAVSRWPRATTGGRTATNSRMCTSMPRRRGRGPVSRQRSWRLYLGAERLLRRGSRGCGSSGGPLSASESVKADARRGSKVERLSVTVHRHPDDGVGEGPVLQGEPPRLVAEQPRGGCDEI